MRFIQIFSLILGLSLFYTNCFGQENESVVQQQPSTDLFMYNTVGSFSVLLVMSVFGIYAYNNIIKNKELKIFGSHKKKKN